MCHATHRCVVLGIPALSNCRCGCDRVLRVRTWSAGCCDHGVTTAKKVLVVQRKSARGGKAIRGRWQLQCSESGGQGCADSGSCRLLENDNISVPAMRPRTSSGMVGFPMRPRSNPRSMSAAPAMAGSGMKYTFGAVLIAAIAEPYETAVNATALSCRCVRPFDPDAAEARARPASRCTWRLTVRVLRRRVCL